MYRKFYKLLYIGCICTAMLSMAVPFVRAATNDATASAPFTLTQALQQPVVSVFTTLTGLFERVRFVTAAVVSGELPAPGYPVFKKETYTHDPVTLRAIPNFADVDVLKRSDNEFYITGTAPNTQLLKIYKTTDLNTFTLETVFNPSLLSESKNFCAIWAPDLSFIDGAYVLTFSAEVRDKSVGCGGLINPMMYQVTSPDLFHFGMPKRLAYGSVVSGTVNNTYNLRIDPDYFRDRLYYVWLAMGNSIASVHTKSPYGMWQHANATAADGYVVEAPQLFTYNNQVYLQYSQHHWRHAYSSYYMKADNQSGLRRDRSVPKPFAEALLQPGCTDKNSERCVIENYGHGAIFNRNGQYYYLHHRANPSVGSFTRSSFLQPLYFTSDGSIVHLTQTTLAWNNLGSNYRYSFDVLPKGGTWIGPCIDSGVIQSNTSVTHRGVCSHDGQMVRKQDIDKFRICYSGNMLWTGGQARCKVIPNDLTKDLINVELEPIPTVQIYWNDLGSNYRYSLDILPKGGAWIAPCVSEYVLGNRTSYIYNGACSSVTSGVPLQYVERIRLCYAKDGRWEAGYVKCVTSDYVMGTQALRLSLSPV